jgi:hypothetical protein
MFNRVHALAPVSLGQSDPRVLWTFAFVEHGATGLTSRSRGARRTLPYEGSVVLKVLERRLGPSPGAHLSLAVTLWAKNWMTEADNKKA